MILTALQLQIIVDVLGYALIRSQNNQYKRILIFDSGLGGLSVLYKFFRDCVHADLYYVADTGGFPYGKRSKCYLESRLGVLLGHLIDVIQPDAIILACNTAATFSLESPSFKTLTKTTRIPFLGVKPSIEQAVKQTKTHVVGVIGTERTMSCAYTRNLLDQYADRIKFQKHTSKYLASYVEHILLGEACDKNKVYEEIAPLFKTTGNNAKTDVICLACTHYPLIVDMLNLYAPWDMNWIDSSQEVVDSTRKLLNLETIASLNVTEINFIQTSEKYSQRQLKRLFPNQTVKMHCLNYSFISEGAA